METINEIISYSSQILRGHMNFEEYQNDLLAAIFYKYLSYKIEKENNKKLFKYDINFREAFDDENIEFYGKKIKEESINELGFFIEEKNLYSNLINQNDCLQLLNDAIHNIEFKDKSLYDLFDNTDFQEIKSFKETENLFNDVLVKIDSLTFKNEKSDEFNDLMKFFMKKSYTPNEISDLLAGLLFVKDKKLVNVYDAACGSCSSLLRLKNHSTVINFYGQEFNRLNYNMARMNMIMHDVLPDNFFIFNEDSTTAKRKLPLMDAIISHPPFLKKWNACEELLDDERFNSYKKLPPKSKADYAFIETMIYHLDDDGIMAVALPQGVLFRTNAEKEIRKNFIINNYIDAVIGLPEKTFPKNIPTCIIIFRKNRSENDEIMFIDASNSYKKGNTLNVLRDSDITRIIDAYNNRTEIEKYSYLGSIDEVKSNDFNLNIKLYVDTYVEKDRIDIQKSLKEIDSLEVNINSLKNKQKDLIKQIYDSV